MADDTNPVTTPTDQPARDATGTLLNQASTEPTKTDSSQTSQNQQQTESGKKDGDQKDTDSKSTIDNKTALNKDDKGTPQGAPEKYTDFKLPTGLTLEPKALEEATAVFKGLNLSQDAAQSLVDFHAKQLQSAIDKPINTVTQIKQDWEGKLKATYGAKLEPGGEVITRISRMIDSLPTQIGADFREAMDLTLAGSNPGFVAAFDIISQRLSEGKAVPGKGPSPLGQAAPDAKPKSVAQAMYPHLKSASDSS